MYQEGGARARPSTRPQDRTWRAPHTGSDRSWGKIRVWLARLRQINKLSMGLLKMFRQCKRKVKYMYLAMLSVLLMSLPLLFIKAPSWLCDLSIPTAVPSIEIMKASTSDGSTATAGRREESTSSTAEVAIANQQAFIVRNALAGLDNSTSDTTVTGMRGRSLEGSPLTVTDVTDPQLCAWVNRSSTNPPYFITAVLLVRIYKHDKPKLTTAELNQWLLYLSYSGVEHVYVYDAFYTEDESQRDALEPFIRDNYITYIDWHEYNPYTMAKTQIQAYQHCIDNHKTEHLWQTAIDIDEYPFSPVDTKPGFLARFVKHKSEADPSLSHITMQNFLFQGMPLKKELLIERLWRHTHGVSNLLCKPIYKSIDVRHASIHNNAMARGSSEQAPILELRMNHYWGARAQNWGPDTPETLQKTEEDHSMEPIVRAFKDCEAYLRKYMPYTDGNYTYG